MNQLHLYDPTPPPATITWNPHKKQKKKNRPNLHASPLVDLISEAKLHGNG